MDRNAFGSWGARLPRDDFACAVAAVGVETDADHLGDRAALLGDKALRWNLPSLPPPADADPRALSDAWRALAADAARPLRVAVGAWPQELRTPAWLLQELSRPSVGLDGVYLEVPRRRSAVRWSWPLQIAILDGGRSTLRERLVSDPPWTFSQFAELVEVESPEPCDLLIVPGRLRGSLARILPLSVTASVVVLLERLDEPWQRAHSLVDALLADTEASGVAFAPSGDEPAWWLDAVLETLAHDVGLDVALLAAARRLDLPAPALLAQDSLLEETRMSRVRDRMTARMREGAVMANGGGPALESMAEAVEAAPSFEHETAGATVVADASRELREALPPPEPRFLQAQVFGREDGVESAAYDEPARALRPDALHEIVVRVGPRELGWLTATAAFPEEELPPAEEHRLKVVLTEPSLLDEPQTAEILLRPAGPSTSCSFWIRTADAGRLDARLIVLHEGRVIQTGLLRGEITAEPVDDERALRFEIEVLVHQAADLAGRTRFDAAFVLNEDAEEVSRVTLVAGEHVDISEPTDLQDAVDKIRAFLENAVTTQGEATLEDETTRKLLVVLARHGSLLHKALLDRHGGVLTGTERLQIVAVEPEAYLPLEFVYDRTAPRMEAKLCPNARQALATGTCDGCPALTDASFVCPLGFWCLSKVIERHLHKQTGVAGVEGNYRVQNAPTSTRTRLAALSSGVFGASSRVDQFREGTIDEVAKALDAATGSPRPRAKTWADWVEAVTAAPALLVVLPHTLLDESSILALEIEDAEQLSVVDITESHVGGSGPVVVLLGCETGDPGLAFQQFPAAFRQAGAAIVIATLTKVLGRNAGPTAARLVKTLAESAREREVTFGEVLRDVRRSLLADGMPTVLAVTAYGDADWILGPTNGG
jgi:hypothetical protein